ncbi:hypothetical protein XENTR_v10005408 [Xenopus tropicalis]|nr:hypothetical protein XENTR_v10005408 [Xenopus tropicalis]
MSYKRTKCFHCRKDYNLKKSFGISKEPTIIVCKIKEDISSNNVTAVDKSEGENYVHEITQQNAISQHTKDSYLKRHGVLKDVKVVIHQLSKKDLADLDNINHKPDLLGGWIITKCSSCKNQGDKKRTTQGHTWKPEIPACSMLGTNKYGDSEECTNL